MPFICLWTKFVITCSCMWCTFNTFTCLCVSLFRFLGIGLKVFSVTYFEWFVVFLCSIWKLYHIFQYRRKCGENKGIISFFAQCTGRYVLMSLKQFMYFIMLFCTSSTCSSQFNLSSRIILRYLAHCILLIT